MSETTAPTLWHTPADRDALRQRIAMGEPTACAILERARMHAACSVDEALSDVAEDTNRSTALGADHPFLDACAVAYLITGEAAYATKAHDLIAAFQDDVPKSDLGKSWRAQIVSIVYQCCYDGWTPAQRATVGGYLLALLHGLRTINKGNPYQVGNNWWAVTHGGALLAALALHGQPDPTADAGGAVLDLREEIAWAKGRLRAFAHHFGDAGIYHEGLGYQCYACQTLLPALLALRLYDGYDLCAEFPNLGRMGASLWTTAVKRSSLEDSGPNAESAGSMLSWNDSGQSWGQMGVIPLMVHLTPADQRGALRWLYDQFNGIQGNQRYCDKWAGLYFSLVFYPYDIPAVEPTGVLPLHVTDTRQGMMIHRDRWRDGDDAVLGLYARATHMGGHSQDDAGSIRLQALGHDWAMGGGQARPKAEFQTVPVAVGVDRPKPTGCGMVMLNETTANGAILAVDLRKVLGCHAERYVAVAHAGPGRDGALGADGPPLALAVLDQIDDHRGLPFDWCWTYARDLALAIHEDGQGFTLAHEDGTRLDARFLGSAPASVAGDQTPDSKRTYSGGATVHYPGRPFLRARFDAAEHLGIYVVMAIHRGSEPMGIEPAGEAGALPVRIGSRTWERPFGAAIPEAFRLGRSGGLCKNPDGIPV